MNGSRFLVRVVLMALVSALLLLAPEWARAANTPSYTIQRIAQQGAAIGNIANLVVDKGGYFAIGTLNDAGQLIFTAESKPGIEALVQYSSSGQTSTLIAAGGRDAPGGTWPADLSVLYPVSMNQKGNAVFATRGTVLSGTYFWDASARKSAIVAVGGMPAGSGLTFDSGAAGSTPVINYRDEIAFPAPLKGVGGGGDGIFFQAPGGSPQAVALPGQKLPGGRTCTSAWLPSLNNAGVVVFRDGKGPTDPAVYRWEKGSTTPTLVAATGGPAPSGGTLLPVRGGWVNNKNANVLLWARPLQEPETQDMFYLWNAGALTRVLMDGQAMPGGGQLRTIPGGLGRLSAANEAGEHAFIAELADGTRAAYKLDANGTPSLIVKPGLQTTLGSITSVGRAEARPSISLNSKGQVALVVQINGGPDTIVLLTPSF